MVAVDAGLTSPPRRSRYTTSPPSGLLNIERISHRRSFDIAIFAPAHIPASVNDGHNGNTHHSSGRNDRAPPSSFPAPNGATAAVLHARRLRTSKLPPNGPDSQQSCATRASTPDHHVTRWNAGVAGASDAQPGLPHGKHCRWYSTRIAACSAAIPTVDLKWIMVL